MRMLLLLLPILIPPPLPAAFHACPTPHLGRSTQHVLAPRPPLKPTLRSHRMPLKQQLTDDMKAAMKSGDKHSLGVIRLINAAIKQKEVDERIELDDAAVIAVLDKMVKQRKDSVTQFEAAAREDLAQIEREEIVVIERYLPAKMGEAEIVAAIQTAMTETGASSPADIGKLMGALKPKLAGQADMGVLSTLVKQHLAG
ncbi:conserved hypothetical protein [Xanthomonas oryzae pv. oryzae KACC 10331]|uniref:GatB/YqeY domain-containing protein n=3 Tax=Xanthomonas oryzae pv. oryzae TaxID=64187 RepID=Q5GV93_XANOR|nr:conserved hypothetical protein [Xanthomonas oryzae pv. oryzae KACC 10331]